jgi:hypothetical protein
MAKVIEMTGSPKPYFKTKLSYQARTIWVYGRQNEKKDNKVKILVTNNLSSETNKMKTARELGDLSKIS